MHFIIWIIAGGVIGWLAGLIMRTSRRQTIPLNIVAGIVGSLVAGWLFSPMAGVGTVNQGNFSFTALAASLAGAVMVVAAVNLLRRTNGG